MGTRTLDAAGVAESLFELTCRASGPDKASIRQYGRSCWLLYITSECCVAIEATGMFEAWWEGCKQLGEGLLAPSPLPRADVVARPMAPTSTSAEGDPRFFSAIPNT